MTRKTPEGRFSADLDREIRDIFKDAFILKLDEQMLQGIPDKLVLVGEKWAILEVKASKPSDSDFRPNQQFYIAELDEMGFSAVVYPENMAEILNKLEDHFYVVGN